MIINLLKKVKIYILFFLIVLSNRVFSNNFDYLKDLNLNYFNNKLNKIINYDKKRIATQNELEPYDSKNFTDKSIICSVDVKENDLKRKNKIAITIDDNFSDKWTKDILDVLDSHNCKATFFITCKLLVVNPERVYEIINRGHEIANHSMTHPPFKNLHTQRKIWELSTLNYWVYALTNINMSLCRFPTGSFDKEAISVASSLNLYPIGWSIDTNDWKLKNIDKIYNYTTSQKLKSGSIVLFHNGYSFTKELFDKLLTYYENQGYSFLKASELIYSKNFYVKNGVQYLK